MFSIQLNNPVRKAAWKNGAVKWIFIAQANEYGDTYFKKLETLNPSEKLKVAIYINST